MAFPIPEMRCLVCDTLLNHASDDQESVAPRPHDFTVCLYCHHIMAFDETLHLRELTEEEAREAATDQSVADCMEFVKFYSHMYGKGVRH